MMNFVATFSIFRLLSTQSTQSNLSTLSALKYSRFLPSEYLLESSIPDKYLEGIW